jgi:signal transduction histidine kinase
MNVRTLLRPVRRLWPQKVRTRLTLLYAMLFFAAGSALLGLTYGLLASSLPTQPSPPVATVSSRELANLMHECKPGPGTLPDFAACRQAAAYMAGSAAGLQAQREHALRNLLVFSLVGLGVMTVGSGGLGWLMSGRVLRPVRVITETARRPSEQHLGERLALTGARDELKELADTFDDMLERLDAAFATQRRFVANASHELRTPLTVMRTAIDVTLAKPGLPESLLQARVNRDDTVHAGERDNADDSLAGDHQPQLTALGPRPPLRGDQRIQPGRIAKPGPGHVDHDHGAPRPGRLQQGGPQAGGVGDVDLLGRRHHRHALDHLDREADLRHRATSCADRSTTVRSDPL